MKHLFTSKESIRFSAFWCKVFILCAIGIVSFTNTGSSQSWTEDWEGNWVVDWHVDGGTWEVGTPTSGPDSAYNGQNCAATVLAGNYPTNANTRLIRHTSFVVPSADQNPRLRFWHWYSILNDAGRVQIKVGSGDWQTISHTYINTGSGVWTYTSIDLSAYSDSTVQIAFYFTSNTFTQSSGWYIDDIAIITGPVVFNNPETWEMGLGDWYGDRGTWEVGEPTSGPGGAYMGLNCAATRLNGNYHTSVTSRFTSPSFVVPGTDQNPRLRFWHWYSTLNDAGKVQIKVGAGAWQTISSSYINTGGGVWTYTSIDLSAYSDSTVQIGFLFTSNTFTQSSGWYIDDIAIITGPVVFNNPETWEMGLGDWYGDRGTWEVGEPTSGPDSAFTGQNCAATILNGGYHTSVTSRFTSPSFILPGASANPGLTFWHWYSLSNDQGYVQIKVGNDNWQTILGPYTNNSGGIWSPVFVDLTPYADSTVQIGFLFTSNTFTQSSGWYIDDIMILPYIVPVELTSFTANVSDADVHLNWSTATETNNQGFEIQRRNEDSEYQKIGYVPGHGTTTEVQIYSYVDSKVVSGNYFYRLKQIDFNGQYEYSGEIEVEVSGPLTFALEQNYPNPFNPSTTIHYSLPINGNVEVIVYDVLGNQVTTLVNEEKPAGSYEINFNATNLSSGIYFYKLQSGNFVEIKKMILLR